LWPWLALFVALNLIDLAATVVGLGHIAGVREGNPLAAALYRGSGVPGLVFYKVGICAMALSLTALLFRTRPRLALALIMVADVLVCLVVMNNAPLAMLAR
jgi:hypothetical protein